jgi:hypothetical protein
MAVPTLLGLLEREEDGNRSIFRNVVLFRKHWTMDKVQKHDILKCVTGLSVIANY